MADRMTCCPAYVWEIKNAYSFKKQTSPIFSFLGVNWTLHLQHCHSVRGEQIQIFLRRLTSCNVSQDLRVTVSLIDCNGALCCEGSLCNLVYSLSEWCVWHEEKDEIRRHIGGNTLTFFCSILPTSKWKDILHYGHRREIMSSGAQSLLEDFGKMFDNQEQSDVIVKCGNEQIHAHKLILSSRSKVFAAMFQNNMKESRTGLIEIANTDPSIMKDFLRFLYVGKIPYLSLISALKVYILADKYAVNSLKEYCANFMIDEVDDENLFKFSLTADEIKWKSRIRTHITNIKAVLRTENWKSMTKEQLKASLEAFDTFVKDAYLKICSELSGY